MTRVLVCDEFSKAGRGLQQRLTFLRFVFSSSVGEVRGAAGTAALVHFMYRLIDFSCSGSDVNPRFTFFSVGFFPAEAAAAERRKQLRALNSRSRKLCDADCHPTHSLDHYHTSPSSPCSSSSIICSNCAILAARSSVSAPPPPASSSSK